MRNAFALATGIALSCSGCFGGSSADLSVLSAALVAASSIGHAASLTVGSMSSGGVVCAGNTPPCTTFPCNNTTTVTLGPQCPLPLGGQGSGTVIVASAWSQQGVGTLDETFVGNDVGDGKIALSQAEGVSVKDPVAQNIVTIAYVGQSVSVSSGATLAAQSAWAVSVDTKGTADPSDDVYTANGSQQGTGTSGVGQVAITGAVFDPSCRRNPIAGSATVEEVGTSGGLGGIQLDYITFHTSCDGNADVKGTTGGVSEVALRLFSH